MPGAGTLANQGWRFAGLCAIMPRARITEDPLMAKLLNGRTLLGLAFVGLAALAGVMVVSNASRDRDAAKPAPRVVAAKAAPTPSAPVAVASAAPAAEPFVIKRVLPIQGAIKYGDWHWDDKDVPAGPIVVTVDLDARVISVFRDGYEIGASAVLLGTEDKPTPLGVFPITQKKRHHVSNLYDAEMPYMQRLTDDGITLHATNVRWGYASHGCIGMPEAFAKKVFETTSVGDKVYITRGKMIGVGDPLTS
jgi:lipoprotein-anchoring transpeptidase ErfK/SrfK